MTPTAILSKAVRRWRGGREWCICGLRLECWGSAAPRGLIVTWLLGDIDQEYISRDAARLILRGLEE